MFYNLEKGMRIMAADAIDKGRLAAVKFLMGRLEPCIANFDCFFLDKRDLCDL